MLDVSGVSLSFGGVKAVRDVSLTVAEGKIVGLIGTNGAGKTTLFNMISGFAKPQAGSMRFDGADITREEPSTISRRGLLRTFQTPLGFPRMTVLENMLVFSKEDAALRKGYFARGTPDPALLERALAQLDTVGLASRINVWAQDLSAPELKMLEFARAMMAEPRLLMLDEPAAGVNPALLESLTERIHAMRENGITFLVVDHNLKFICDICDEIYAMADGQVIAHGRPDDVVANEAVLKLYIGSAATKRGEAARHGSVPA